MTVFLLRHGQTQGNLERRYIGSSDQPLCAQGREALKTLHPPAVDKLYVSPLLRCRETAALLYPGMEQEAVPGLREADMGVFEGHTYEELKDDPTYQAWLDSAGESPPPGGENKETVRQRTASAFLSIVQRHKEKDRIALVIHGGTIMTILELFEAGHQFYSWQVPNGGGWQCRWREGRLTDVEKLK